mmetsp:Transcript_61312/g.158138  ORF Transcript_61312/g.158138 Transcript_61312/m.158138 type:complete len:211 (+) Transcript_61312:2358-2990(+)
MRGPHGHRRRHGAAVHVGLVLEHRRLHPDLGWRQEGWPVSAARLGGEGGPGRGLLPRPPAVAHLQAGAAPGLPRVPPQQRVPVPVHGCPGGHDARGRHAVLRERPRLQQGRRWPHRWRGLLHEDVLERHRRRLPERLRAAARQVRGAGRRLRERLVRGLPLLQEGLQLGGMPPAGPRRALGRSTPARRFPPMATAGGACLELGRGFMGLE